MFGIQSVIKRGTQVWTVFFDDGRHFDYNSMAEHDGVPAPHWCLWPYVIMSKSISAKRYRDEPS